MLARSSVAAPREPSGNERPRRLLLLMPYAPRPDADHGGARVMGQLVAQLVRRHEVAVAYLRVGGEPPMDEGLRALCARVEEVELNFASGFPGTWMRWARVFLRLLGGTPRRVSNWAVEAFARRVRALCREWRPDVVHLEYGLMGQYLPALDGCAAPRILTEYEPGWPAAVERLRAHRGPGRWLDLLDVRAWRRYEAAVVRQVQAVVAFTERDRQELLRHPAAPSVVRIPFGTAIPDRPLDPLGRAPPGLLFVGNFLHPPNRDAALRLVHGIFPPLRERHPGLVLRVVGEGLSPDVRARPEEDVVFTGHVPDVAPYLDEAAVVVVPLRQGGGMRVKVLEALAAGKAVVASPLAVEGLDVRDGEQVLLAGTDREFREAVSALLDDPARRGALAARARAWACASLGWERAVAEYERLYSTLAGVAEREVAL